MSRLFFLRSAPAPLPFESTIAGRAISSLIHSQGLGDLYTIYLNSQRDGIDCNLGEAKVELLRVDCDRSLEFASRGVL